MEMDGLQNKGYEYISNELMDFMSKYFNNKIGTFIITYQTDKPHTEFSFNFTIYNYFVIKLNYDRGRFGCSIIFGEAGLSIDISQKWYDQADLRTFCKELDDQVRLRIPDKYLNSFEERN